MVKEGVKADIITGAMSDRDGHVKNTKNKKKIGKKEKSKRALKW